MIIAGLEDQIGHQHRRAAGRWPAAARGRPARFDIEPRGRLMVTMILGNQRRRTLPCSREKGCIRRRRCARAGSWPGFVGDHAGPSVDLHQRAGDGDAAFREDHAMPARTHHLDQRSSAAIGRSDRWEGIDQDERRAHPPGLGDMGIDGEGRAARQEARDQTASRKET